MAMGGPEVSSAVAANPLALHDYGSSTESHDQSAASDIEPARYTLRKKLRAHVDGKPQLWLGGDRRLKNQVVISRYDFNQPSHQAQFEQTLAMLKPRYPNVPGLIDVFHDLTTDMRCLVREYVAGDELSTFVGRVSLRNAIDLSIKLATIFHNLHAYRPAGLSVGSVALENFVVSQSDDIWLIDSPNPTQITFDSANDAIRADIKRAALLSLQLIFGVDPFVQIDNERRLALLPAALADVLRKASHHDPDQRYASAQWFARALTEASKEVGDRLVNWNEHNASCEQPLAPPTFRPVVLSESAAAYSLLTASQNQITPSLKWAYLAHQALELRERQNDPTTLSSLETIDCIHYAHQQDTALQALNRPEMMSGAILADEVGLGKTIEALIVCQEMRARGQADSILIVAPPAGTTQWLMEARRRIRRNANERGFRLYQRAEDASYPLLIVSSATLRQDKRLAMIVEQRNDDLLIVDEAHQCCSKRRDSKGLSTLGRALSKIKRKRTLLLTATPLGERLHDVVTLADMIRPGIVGTRSQLSEGLTRASRKSNPDSDDAIRILRAKLGSVLIRHRRVDNPTISAPTVRYQSVRFPALSGDEAKIKIRSALGLINGRMAGERIVVFCKSAPLREQLVEELTEQTPDRRVIAFQANKRHSRAMEGLFNEYPDAIIIANDVVAEGMNWQAARFMIHLDLPTTPLAWEQRTGRIYRLGQLATSLEIVHLIVAGSNEEKVMNIYEHDLGLFTLPIGEAASVLDHLKNPMLRNLEAPISAILRGGASERKIGELSAALRDARKNYDRHSRELSVLDDLLFGVL